MGATSPGKADGTPTPRRNYSSDAKERLAEGSARRFNAVPPRPPQPPRTAAPSRARPPVPRPSQVGTAARRRPARSAPAEASGGSTAPRIGASARAPPAAALTSTSASRRPRRCVPRLSHPGRGPPRATPLRSYRARPGAARPQVPPPRAQAGRHGTAPPSRREGRRRHGRPRPRHAPAARSRARRSPRRGRRPYAAPAPAATAERRLASSRAGGALVAARGCTKREARPLSRPAPLPPRRTSGAASPVQTAAPTSPAALLIPPSEGRAPAGNTYVKSEGSDPRRPRRARGTFPELARCAARAAFHAPLTSPNSLTRPAAPLRTASKAPGIHPP